MTRPIRVKSTAVGVKANDHQLHRLQAVGMSSALNPEQIKEIGGTGYTEVIDGIPTVDVTLDKNQNGSMKELCVFANKNFDYGYVQASVDSGFTVSISDDDYFINEMKYTFSGGSANLTSYVPTSGSASRVVVLSLSTAGALTLTSGTQAVTPTAPSTPSGQLKIAEVYLTSGQADIDAKHILNCHDYVTIVETDFENASVDLWVAIKEDGDNEDTDKYITRTGYCENVYLNRLDLAYNTGGVSTENMAGETDNRKWFLNSKRAIISERYVTAASHTLSYTPTTLANGNKTLKVRNYYNGTYTDYVEGTDFNVSGTTLTWVGGSQPASGNNIVRYCADQDIYEAFKKLPNPDESHPQPAGALNQGHSEIYLSDDESNMVLRIESCTLSLGLTREALNEIGHELPYARPLNLPIPVTVTLNTTASDLQELARLCGYTTTEFNDGSTVTELALDDFVKNLTLYVYTYRETDQKRAEAPYSFQPYLKKVTIDDLSVTDDAFDLRVDANATQNWTLDADNITIQGCV